MSTKNGFIVRGCCHPREICVDPMKAVDRIRELAQAYITNRMNDAEKAKIRSQLGAWLESDHTLSLGIGVDEHYMQIEVLPLID